MGQSHPYELRVFMRRKKTYTCSDFLSIFIPAAVVTFRMQRVSLVTSFILSVLPPFSVPVRTDRP